MSIRWDSLLSRHLAEELNEALEGARVRAVRLDARARDLAVFFRDRTLLWRLHPDRGSPVFLDAVEPDPRDPRLKARVRRVYAPPDERIVIFELIGERRGSGPFELVVELLGNQMNALVTEGADRTIRHVLKRRDGRRPARVGHPYTPPPPTSRAGVRGEISPEEWRSILDPSPPPDRASELVRRIAWTSPINAAAFVDSRDAWSAAVRGEAPGGPVILDTDRGPQPYPFPLPSCQTRDMPSLIAAFESCAAERADLGDTEPVLSIGPQLYGELEDAVAHYERRVVRLLAQLEARENPDALRAIGDLILSRYAEIPAGASRAVLTGFDGAELEVELDPARPPHENASQYYGRAGRSERTAERVPAILEKAREDLERLRKLFADAQAGAVDESSIRAALPQVPVRSQRGDTPPSLPYKTFRSSGGLEIRVGRGAKHNDDLTFRHSAPGDVWLHARHTAGAHVILRWSGPGGPPSRDLEEAGILAAMHSKARMSGSVPVDWTLRKYVRKPRGAPPGSVLPDRVKTVFVTPDPALVETLADEG
jgi:predicted ribosome quality control (RQC) complex YloA/Tae2 family protein